MGNICGSPMAERLLVCAARELVEALGKARRGRPRPETTSTTRGGGEEYFDRAEDEIEATVRALARAARTLIARVSAMWIWGITVTCRLCWRSRYGGTRNASSTAGSPTVSTER